jgi:anti-sigma B factor antagonist
MTAPMDGALNSSEPALIDGVAVLTVGERLTVLNCAPFLAQAEEALARTGQVVVDLARTNFVDSSGYGALITVGRRARGRGGEVHLAALQPQVAQALRLLRMEQFFTVYADTAGALSAAADCDPAPAAASRETPSPSGWQIARAPRRLDAATAPQFRAQCAALLADGPRLIVDFSETVFLASAGLAALIALSREARNLEGDLRLACLMPDALQVMKLARLDGVFAIYPTVAEAGS